MGFFRSCLGEIDVVASVPGKVVPSGRSKLIQASEVAIVQSIHVHLSGDPEGKKVQYLDALEVAQVTADDFLFAKPAMVTAKALAIVPQSGLQLAESTLAMQPASLAERPSTTPAPLPNVANLVEAMAAFLPQPGGSALAAQAPVQPWESTLAVAV